MKFLMQNKSIKRVCKMESSDLDASKVIDENKLDKDFKILLRMLFTFYYDI